MDFDHKDQQRLEQIVQQTRWDEVTDARQRVLDRLQAIDRLQFNKRGAVSKDRISTLQQRTVQLYVQQVETILDPDDDDKRTTPWWTNEWIGQFELPNEEVVRVMGLSDYINLSEEIEYTVEEQYKPHGAHIGKTREVTCTTTPPIGIHRNAFRATNRGLSDQGIDFDTRDRDVDDDDAGIGNAVGL